MRFLGCGETGQNFQAVFDVMKGKVLQNSKSRRQSFCQRCLRDKVKGTLSKEFGIKRVRKGAKADVVLFRKRPQLK